MGSEVEKGSVCVGVRGGCSIAGGVTGRSGRLLRAVMTAEGLRGVGDAGGEGGSSSMKGLGLGSEGS